MIKKYTSFLLALVFYFPIAGRPQTANVKGMLIDASTGTSVPEASISILNAIDSLLIADCRSEKDGSFYLGKLPPGSYILLVTYPQFADFVERFSIDTSLKDVVFKRTSLLPKADILKEVVVSSASSIRFKGDTLEYKADSFHVQPNASVEDLLKQLPGIQVDMQGRITARGITVQKVLVDGEEFFGDDPTLVTKNLKAEMVDKIQLFDKTSDQAAFTKIDDGVKIRTINVKLKKDKKNGYFGKVEAGGGPERFYENQAMFNSFEGDRKLSAYFTISNTGKIGLDPRSQKNYAADDETSVPNDLDSWDGRYNGVGIPKSISGGIHYDNKWDEENQSLSGNYKIGSLTVPAETNVLSQEDLPGRSLYSSLDQKTNNHIFRQSINISYNFRIDSTSMLKMFAEGYLLGKSTNETDSAETNQEKQTLLNTSDRNTTSNGNLSGFNTNILLEKRLKKDGRTLSLNFNVRVNDNQSTGILYSRNSFYDPFNVIDSAVIIDQHKTFNTHSTSVGGKATYTEPLSKISSIVLNYGILADNNKSDLLSFNNSGPGYYKSLDSTYSNSYEFDQFSNRGGVAWNFNKQKWRIQTGSDVAVNTFHQQNIFDNYGINRLFLNWFPFAKLTYQFSQLRSFSINYAGNAVQPTIQQIQPLLNNNDPLNIYAGNTNLVPAFSDNFSVNYLDYQIISGTLLTMDGHLSFIRNAITTSVQTDTTGKNIYTYINLATRQNVNYSLNASYSSKVHFWDMGLGVTIDANGNKYAMLSNQDLNVIGSNNFKMQFILSKFKEKLYNLGIGFGPMYSTFKSSLQSNIDNNSWGYTIAPDFDFYLPHNLEIHTDANYFWQGKTETFNSDYSRFIWNVWVGKKLLKGNNLLIKLLENDILNQNTGFNRSTFNNQIVQNTYSTVARYFLVSATWDFSKNRGKNNK